MEGKGQVICCSREVSASLHRGQRSVLILPFSKRFDDMVGNRSLAVLEPYRAAGDTVLFAADYAESYGWQPAHMMPPVYSRMRLEIERVRMVYDRDLVERDFLADGVYRIGCAFAWERVSERPLEYATAAEAWSVSRMVAWGRTARGPRETTKSLLVNVAVKKVDRRVA